jgi:hypothetical protein
MSKTNFRLSRTTYTLLEDIYKIAAYQVEIIEKAIFIPDGTICKKYGLRSLYFDGQAAP